MPDVPPGDGPKFHGRRRGHKLRRLQAERLETLLPGLAIPEPAGDERVDPSALFTPRPAAVWLEIGFGSGEHLAAQAARHPEIGLIGCEVFVNGIARLVGHVAELGLANIRVFPEDARRLLPALAPASLERVFLLFPDPWPKARHAERRFINPGNLDLLARVMAPGAELVTASDDAILKEWMPARLDEHAAFQALEADPTGWPQTRYQKKAVRLGREPAFFVYRRR